MFNLKPIKFLTIPVLSLSLFSLALPAYASPEDDSPGALIRNPSEQLQEARASLGDLEISAAQAVEAFNQAQADQAKASTAYQEALKAFEAAKKEVTVAKEKLGQYASNVYKNGAGESGESVQNLTNMFTAESPVESARAQAVVGYVQDRKADTVGDLKDAQSKADKTEKEAKELKAKADNLAQEATKRSDEAKAAVTAAQEALKVLEADEYERQRIADEEARAAAEYAAWAAAQAASIPAVTESAPAPVAVPAASSEVTSKALDAAFAQIGKPYVWGATGPDSFDCSGFTSFAYRAAGVELPRTSRDQARTGTTVPVDQLQVGDLVFFGSPVYHVGIYVGDGFMIHAPKPGDVVKVAKMWTTPSSATRLA